MLFKKINFCVLSGVLSSLLLFSGASFLNADASKPKAKENRAASLERLTHAIGVVQNSYVSDISIDEIVDKAISGLMSNLDAHSAYLQKKDFEDLKTITTGSFSGIGISVGMKEGALTIVAPIEGSPGDKAGLKSGDIILKIDEKSTLDMKLDQAVTLIKGKKGSSIKLTIVRRGESKPLIFDITRDEIKVISTYTKKIEGSDFAYLRVNNFDSNVTSVARKGLAKIDNLNGIVLDLRSNPGGLLDQAIGLTSLFVQDGVVLLEKGKSENKKIKALGNARFKDIPLVVLVNGGSASASEIVSGSLQDHNRAIVVGEQTFGKGSVQQVIRLGNEEALKLTTAKYYLPSGRSIQAVGVKPNIVVASGPVNIDDRQGFELKEADLKMHLKNEFLSKEGESKDDKKDTKLEKEKEKEYITKGNILKDLQLKTAIDVLNSWNFIKGEKLQKDSKNKKEDS